MPIAGVTSASDLKVLAETLELKVDDLAAVELEDEHVEAPRVIAEEPPRAVLLDLAVRLEDCKVDRERLERGAVEVADLELAED